MAELDSVLTELAPLRASCYFEHIQQMVAYVRFNIAYLTNQDFDLISNLYHRAAEIGLPGLYSDTSSAICYADLCKENGELESAIQVVEAISRKLVDQHIRSPDGATEELLQHVESAKERLLGGDIDA